MRQRDLCSPAATGWEGDRRDCERSASTPPTMPHETDRKWLNPGQERVINDAPIH